MVNDQLSMVRKQMMVEGVVLAAGSSSRAGCFKMELPLGDKTLIERSIEGMYNICARIVVVGGYRVERVRELLAGYSKLEIVENKDWQRGMFSSIQAGAAFIRSERFFVLPADIALVPEHVYRQLASSEGNIVVPVHKGRKGHPILIRSSLVAEILSEPSHSTLREILRRRGCETVEAGEETILMDVDTIDDYRKALDFAGYHPRESH